MAPARRQAIIWTNDGYFIDAYVHLRPQWVDSLVPGRCGSNFNPLHAKFFRGNINIYLHFVLFLHIDTALVIEILPQIRQEPTYST